MQSKIVSFFAFGLILLTTFVACTNEQNESIDEAALQQFTTEILNTREQLLLENQDVVAITTKLKENFVNPEVAQEFVDTLLSMKKVYWGFVNSPKYIKVKAFVTKMEKIPSDEKGCFSYKVEVFGESTLDAKDDITGEAIEPAGNRNYNITYQRIDKSFKIKSIFIYDDPIIGDEY
jgi:LPS O-antigen subunit length determinant protein (WzzB/FepE family)